MLTNKHGVSFPCTRDMACTCGASGILCCMGCTWFMNAFLTSMLTAALCFEAAEGIIQVPGKAAVNCYQAQRVDGLSILACIVGPCVFSPYLRLLVPRKGCASPPKTSAR